MQASGSHAKQKIKHAKMKKIFTLIVSLGLLTAAFAQDGKHSSNSTPNHYNQSYKNQGDNKKYNNDQGKWQDKNSNSWSFQSTDRRNDDHYDNGHSSKNEYAKRDDVKGWSDNGRFDRKVPNQHPKKDTRKSVLSFFFRF